MTKPEIEDTVQEMWVSTIKAMDTFKPPRSYRSLISWFFKVAINYNIDLLHREAVGGEGTLALEEESIPLDEAATPFPVEFITDPTLRQAILSLGSSLQRQVIIMKFFLGLSNVEIANTVGQTEGAIKSLQHRALQNLKKILQTGG